MRASTRVGRGRRTRMHGSSPGGDPKRTDNRTRHAYSFFTSSSAASSRAVAERVRSNPFEAALYGTAALNRSQRLCASASLQRTESARAETKPSVVAIDIRRSGHEQSHEHPENGVDGNQRVGR